MTVMLNSSVGIILWSTSNRTSCYQSLLGYKQNAAIIVGEGDVRVNVSLL